MTDIAEREIALTRILDAPRELVWKAWTEPQRLTRWWGKRGWTAPLETITMDVRPGGRFALTNVNDADGRELRQEAVYREVVEPERLVFVEPVEGNWHEGATSTVTFTDLGDGRTEMTFRSTLQTSAEMFDTARDGLSSALDRLADHLRSTP